MFNSLPAHLRIDTRKIANTLVSGFCIIAIAFFAWTNAFISGDTNAYAATMEGISNQVEGKVQKDIGTVKRNVGKVSGQAEGAFDQAKGKAKQDIGTVKNKLDEAQDNVEDTSEDLVDSVKDFLN